MAFAHAPGGGKAQASCQPLGIYMTGMRVSIDPAGAWACMLHGEDWCLAGIICCPCRDGQASLAPMLASSCLASDLTIADEGYGCVVQDWACRLQRLLERWAMLLSEICQLIAEAAKVI